MMQFDTTTDDCKEMMVERYEHGSFKLTSGISKMLYKITCTQVSNNNSGQQPTVHCRIF
jgi:hypothetical protein